ncbi:MAG: hypothetical protein HC933_06490 [Pleurocapsa sp. SU_196_0]|nr:hypothetical protein [Pleurocapsa sp. SU_196_0]
MRRSAGIREQENTVLEATLFANAVLRVDGLEVHPPTRKALGLIVLLLLEGEISRERLSSLLWGDLNPERSRRNLRQELYRLSASPSVFSSRGEANRCD